MDISALTLSTGVVALAEMGDKTQLLSLMLAARYPKQALAIITGILIATIANHAWAGSIKVRISFTQLQLVLSSFD